MHRARRVAARENPLVRQKRFGGSGVTLVTTFTPNLVATVRRPIPILQMIRVRIRLRVREMTISAKTHLRLARCARNDTHAGY
jgi:hypothetical protein